MHIYALSRFILPAKESNFILADFERMPYAYATDTVQTFLAGVGEKDPDLLAKRYFKIGNLYHHIRHRIVKNVFMNTPYPLSSIILVGATNHFNFGRDVDTALWTFCNTMWEGWSKDNLLMHLDEYP